MPRTTVGTPTTARPAAASIYPKPEVLQLAKTMTLYVKHKRALKTWFLGMPQRHSAPLQAAVNDISPPGDVTSFRNEVSDKLKEFQDDLVEIFRKNSADRMNQSANAIRGSPAGNQEEAMKIALHRLRKEYPTTQEIFEEMLRLLPNLPSPSTPARFTRLSRRGKTPPQRLKSQTTALLKATHMSSTDIRLTLCHS